MNIYLKYGQLIRAFKHPSYVISNETSHTDITKLLKLHLY